MKYDDSASPHTSRADALPRETPFKVDTTEWQDRDALVRRLHSALDHISDGVFLVDPETVRFVYANRAGMEMLGCPMPDLLERGPQDFDVDADEDKIRNRLNEFMQSHRVHRPSRVRVQRPDGTMFTGEVQRGIYRYEDKVLVVSILRDVADRVQTETRMQELLTERSEALERTNRNLQLMNTVMRLSVDGVTVTDADGMIQQVNDAFCRVTGYEAEEVIGENPRILRSGYHEADFYENLWRSLKTKGAWEGEIWNRRKNGEAYPESLKIHAIYDMDGEICNYVAIFHDLSEIKAKEEEARYSRSTDPLTQALSRQAFVEHLESAVENASRERSGLAVVIIHINDFRKINETIGHIGGDTVLRTLASHLSTVLDETSTVARLAGSEFGVLVEKIATTGEYLAFKRRLNTVLQPESIRYPFPINVSFSAGMSYYPADGKDGSGLMRAADLALLQSRETMTRPKTGVYLSAFSDKLDQEFQQRIKLEAELLEAIDRRRIRPFYQPRFDIKTNRITGAEALARWIKDDGSVVSPGTFIPFAEDAGLIMEIGALMRNAILDDWETAGAGDGPAPLVSFNVSTLEMVDAGFYEQMEKFAERASGTNLRFEVEITEGNLLHDSDEKLTLLHGLKSLGFSLAMDDFGTGYSSLSYLRRLPLDVVKIDQSFVRHMHEHHSDRAIVRAILAMSQSLELKTVGEGIESADQLDFLASNGCVEGQGYYYGRPMPFEDLQRLLLPV